MKSFAIFVVLLTALLISSCDLQEVNDKINPIQLEQIVYKENMAVAIRCSEPGTLVLYINDHNYGSITGKCNYRVFSASTMKPGDIFKVILNQTYVKTLELK